MEDDLGRLSRSKKAKRPDDLDGPTLRREAGIDPLDDVGTVTPAHPLVLQLRESKGGIRRWCLLDAHLEGNNFVIGRSPECDIPYWWFTGSDVQLATVSRRHIALRVSKEGVYVTDLESKNGTFVSGKRIGKEAITIENGEEVDLGGEFVFRIRKVFGPNLHCIVLQPLKPKGSTGRVGFRCINGSNRKGRRMCHHHRRFSHIGQACCGDCSRRLLLVEEWGWRRTSIGKC